MTDTFDLKLTGRPLMDRTPELAAKALAVVMKITPEQALGMLAGRETVIKRNLPADLVPRYLQAIEGAGVEVRAVRTVTAPPPQPAPAPAETVAAAPAPGMIEKAQSGLALLPMEATAEAADDSMRCPACGALQPKRNLCRECGADMARLLAAQEEAKRAPPESPFAPPTAEVRDAVAEAAETETPKPLALSFQGRIGRLRYLAYILPAYLPLFVAGILGGLLAGFGRSGPGVLFAILVGVGAVLSVLMMVRVLVLRLHDLNLSGLWALLPFGVGFLASFAGPTGVMLVSIVFGIGGLALLFLAGGAEANDYGPPPGPNTAWTIAGAVVVLALWLVGTTMSPERFARVGSKPAAAQLAPDH